MFTKKNIFVKITVKNPTQRKNLYMSLLVGQCLQDVHLIKKENKLNYYRGKDCIENYVKS